MRHDKIDFAQKDLCKKSCGCEPTEGTNSPLNLDVSFITYVVRAFNEILLVCIQVVDYCSPIQNT
jgi:hypothetical protein